MAGLVRRKCLGFGFGRREKSTLAGRRPEQANAQRAGTALPSRLPSRLRLRCSGTSARELVPADANNPSLNLIEIIVSG